MTAYSAFQSNAFQRDAFQIVSGIVESTAVPTRRDKDEYSYHPYLAIAEKRAEVKRIDTEIAETERKKLAAHKRARAKLMAEKAAKKLAALEATLQEEINRLRIERAWLMRRIDDEEAILVLLLTQPFH